MFITRRRDEYLKVDSSKGGVSYTWTKEIDDATRFETIEDANSHLKRSGFNVFLSINVEEVATSK